MRIRAFLLLVLPLTAVSQIDRAKEAALGRQMAEQVNRLSPPIDSPAAQAYVQVIGQRLALALQESGVPDAATQFTFRVINGDLCRETHEPGALPGGYVFVPAALFAQAQDEAEFAGMLAHAMAHVALSHGTRTAYQESGKLGSSYIPLVFVGGMGGSCAEEVIPRALMESLRRNEPEADAVAVQVMAHTGFDPSSLASYLTRLRRLDNRDGRLDAVNKSRARLTPASYAASNGEFTAIREQVIAASKPAPMTGNPPTLRRPR